MVEEVDGVTGAVVAEYLNGRGLDEPLAAVLAGVNGGEPVYFHQDHLGSVELLTDAAGNVLQRYRYDIHGNATVLDAAGNEVGGPESAVSPYLFVGRRFDIESGLYYVRHRYYSPLLGKFISPDPLDYVDGMNVYAYVNGNVVNLVDPMGLANLEVHGAVAVAAAIKAGHGKAFAEAARVGSRLPDTTFGLVQPTTYIPSQTLRAVNGTLSTAKVKIHETFGWIERGVKDTRNAVEDWADKKEDQVLSWIPFAGEKMVKFKYWWRDSSIRDTAGDWAEKIPVVGRLPILQAHYGDESFVHAMSWDNGPKTARELQQEIVKRMMRHANDYRDAIKRGDEDGAGRIFGIASHTLVDSHTASHAARDVAGRITGFYDFTKQSPELHEKGDDVVVGSPLYFVMVLCNTDLLIRFDEYARAEETELGMALPKLRKGLDELFWLSEGATVGEAGDGFGKR